MRSIILFYLIATGKVFIHLFIQTTPKCLKSIADYLTDTDAPYWISGYTDVFNHTTPSDYQTN